MLYKRKTYHRVSELILQVICDQDQGNLSANQKTQFSSVCTRVSIADKLMQGCAQTHFLPPPPSLVLQSAYKNSNFLKEKGGQGTVCWAELMKRNISFFSLIEQNKIDRHYGYLEHNSAESPKLKHVTRHSNA